MAYQTAVNKATQYLEAWIDKSPTDPYQLNIVCYALTLAKSSKAALALQLVNAQAIDKGSVLFTLFLLLMMFVIGIFLSFSLVLSLIAPSF